MTEAWVQDALDLIHAQVEEGMRGFLGEVPRVPITAQFHPDQGCVIYPGGVRGRALDLISHVTHMEVDGGTVPCVHHLAFIECPDGVVRPMRYVTVDFVLEREPA